MILNLFYQNQIPSHNVNITSCKLFKSKCPLNDGDVTRVPKILQIVIMNIRIKWDRP